jgi:hypothetical protein
MVWTGISKASVCIFAGFELIANIQRCLLAANQIHEQSGTHLRSASLVIKTIDSLSQFNFFNLGCFS